MQEIHSKLQLSEGKLPMLFCTDDSRCAKHCFKPFVPVSVGTDTYKSYTHWCENPYAADMSCCTGFSSRQQQAERHDSGFQLLHQQEVSDGAMASNGR